MHEVFMRQRINIFIIFLIFIFAHATFALDTDQQQPANLKADSVQFNRNTGIGTYLGHVEIIQGTTKIFADKIITYSKNNKVYKAIAYGNPAKYQTMPKGNEDTLYANAERISYFLDKKYVILQGNVIVTQDKNTIKSPWISYDVMNAAIETKSAINKNIRTTIVFEPENKTNK